jgi:hypothetical protein
MAEVVQETQQEFWRSPTVLEPTVEAALPAVAHDQEIEIARACADCGTEFMIGARFCHACGLHRPALARSHVEAMPSFWARSAERVGTVADSAAAFWRKISFPDWLQYLHFHEIKRWIGLPTAPLIALIIGLGCVAGALAVSLFYKASNLAEFQAIQMWRIEWLLGATASFVAGILLKTKKRSDRE